MEDRSEDPDLRIAEGSWWPGGVERKSTREVLCPFFRPRRWKMGGILRSSRREGGRWEGFFVLRRKQSQPPPSSVRSSTQSSGPTIEDGGFFDLRLRTSKIEDGGFFDLRPRRSKIEDGGFFDLRLRRSKMEERSSNFGFEDRKLKMVELFDLRVRKSKMGSL